MAELTDSNPWVENSLWLFEFSLLGRNYLPHKPHMWGLRVKRSPKNKEGAEAMPRANRKLRYLARQRALAVLARMRSRGESLSQAARNEHTTPSSVKKVVGKQLKRDTSGHYQATRGDTLRRDLNVLGFDGYQPVVTHSSKRRALPQNI